MEKIRGLILDVDYVTEYERASIRLFIKSGENVFIVKDRNFQPYFYVIPDKITPSLINRIKSIERVINVEIVERKILGRNVKVLKVYTKHPQDVPKVREEVKKVDGVKEIREYDILYHRRYLIDKGLIPMNYVEVIGERRNGYIYAKDIRQLDEDLKENLKILAIDIEAYNPKGTPDFHHDPVIMIGLASNTGMRKVLTWKHIEADFVEYYKDELSMLKRFEEIINEEDFDIIVGYNSDNFDLLYIKKRADVLGLKLRLGRDGSEPEIRKRIDGYEVKLRGRVHVDLYPIIRRNLSLPSYTLEYVAKEILGINKREINKMKIWEIWDKGINLKELAEYCLNDAEIALKLAEKFLPLYYELSRIVKQTLFDVTRATTSQLVEMLLIREAYDKKELCPNKPKEEEREEREEETYAGGYVKEPVKGLHENIVVYDFRALYPSIIITHNIDPSTVNVKDCSNYEIVPEVKHRICKERKGFIPDVLERLVKKRMEIKRKMKEIKDESLKKMLDIQQKALKILANSVYGYMGYANARWYKKECAESIAAYARYYIRKVIEMAEREFNFKVIYSDTDSLFILLNDKNKAKEFLEYVNSKLPGEIKLELEGFYRRGLFITKKKYALATEDNKIIVKGLEFVRRDWAPIAKETQRKVLETLLLEGNIDKAIKIVREIINKLKNRSVKIEDLIIHTQLTKNIEEYEKRLEPHVVAAKKLLKRGIKVYPGQIIGYVITKGSKPISQRAEPAEFVSIEDYDIDYYVENQVLAAVERIFDVLGYSRGFIKHGASQTTLMRWFK